MHYIWVVHTILSEYSVSNNIDICFSFNKYKHGYVCMCVLSCLRPSVDYYDIVYSSASQRFAGERAV